MNLKEAKKHILIRLENELPSNLYYHGIHHTIDVFEAATRLAEAENITDNEKIIVQTAALFHDSGFIHQYNENEVLATKIVSEILPSFNYNQDAIKFINQLILSTHPVNKPVTLLGEILCDADHDYLGREDVKTIADSLYQELQEYSTPFSEDKWNELQINFLDNHQYYTGSAINLRRDKKWDYLRYLKGLK